MRRCRSNIAAAPRNAKGPRAAGAGGGPSARKDKAARRRPPRRGGTRGAGAGHPTRHRRQADIASALWRLARNFAAKSRRRPRSRPPWLNIGKRRKKEGRDLEGERSRPSGDRQRRGGGRLLPCAAVDVFGGRRRRDASFGEKRRVLRLAYKTRAVAGLPPRFGGTMKNDGETGAAKAPVRPRRRYSGE